MMKNLILILLLIIIDDVSQSGITLQSVISNLINYKPKKIKTVVIVNRDQTLFPVKIDFSGISYQRQLMNII